MLPLKSELASTLTQSRAPTSKAFNMSSFTDLPTELRNRIYELALPQGLILALFTPEAATILARETITQIGGQLGSEASSIYLGGNTFRFEYGSSDMEQAVSKFSRALSVDERGFVTRKVLRFCYNIFA